MKISTYYYAGFGGGDFSNEIEWNDIVIEDRKTIDEIIIAAANDEEIEELDCIQELLDAEYDKVLEYEEENTKEHSLSDDEDEDEESGFDGEITIHIYTPSFTEKEVKSCLRRLFRNEDYDTIRTFYDAEDFECFEDVDLVEMIETLAEEYEVDLDE